MADPRKAAAAGISPMRDAPLFKIAGGPPSHADWLRGAVLALLPRGWAYQIHEGIDGTGLLVLTGFDDAR